MATNPNFCKPIDNGARLEYAPVMMFPNPAPPTEAEYNAAGFYRKAIVPPSPPEGKVVGRVTYAVADNVVVAHYEYVDAPPPPPRRWTRLSIKTALAQAGMLAAARTYLSASEIATGYTAWEALTDCDYIEEGFGGEQAWSALLDGAAQALGKSRAEIDAFLDTIPTE